MPEWRCQRRTGKPRRQQPSFTNGILCGFVDPASNSFSFSFTCERVTSFIYTIIHIAHYHFSLTSFFSSSGHFVFFNFLSVSFSSWTADVFLLYVYRHISRYIFCIPERNFCPWGREGGREREWGIYVSVNF